MRAYRWMLIAGVLVLGACSEQRSPTTVADESDVRPVGADPEARRAPMERLARRVALALGDPEFRAYVRQSLDGSRFVEKKLPFSRFLSAQGARAGAALARADGSTPAAVTADLTAAGRLEFYFPVPAHRSAWQGGDDLLVATEVQDHEAPVAFDTKGVRHVLDPRTPPSTPVLAVVPQETDFDSPSALQATTAIGGCTDPATCDINPPPPPQYFPSLPPAGLYLSYFHAAQDFEGWLKGSPEFEIHILAPKEPGDTATYKSIWCVGEKSAANVYWDTDATTWRGDLLIWPQIQMAAFHSQYPTQDFSVLVLEDDDEACKILVDRDLVRNFVQAISTFSHDYKATRDTTTGVTKYVKAAKSGYGLFTSAADLIQTNDDIIGDAIANTVTGLVNAEGSWGLFGPGAARNGWLGLRMK